MSITQIFIKIKSSFFIPKGRTFCINIYSRGWAFKYWQKQRSNKRKVEINTEKRGGREEEEEEEEEVEWGKEKQSESEEVIEIRAGRLWARRLKHSEHAERLFSPSEWFKYWPQVITSFLNQITECWTPAWYLIEPIRRLVPLPELHHTALYIN